MEGLDAGRGGLQAGNDPLAQETGNEVFHLEFGCVTGKTIVAAFSFHDGTKGLELTEALAGGALADFKALADCFHCQGLIAGEEEAINLAVRSGVAEKFRQIGEDGDNSSGRIFQSGPWLRHLWLVFWWRMRIFCFCRHTQQPAES